MIYLGSDHAGYELKEKIKQWLTEWGYEHKDLGPFSFDPEDDYPDFVRPVGEAVAKNLEEHRGIILGGSGQGEAMVVNRIKGVRAAVYYGGPDDIIRLSREHNNANVLSLGARFVDGDTAKRIVRLWLETPFPGEARHIRRIQKIDEFS